MALKKALDCHISKLQAEVTPCWDGERLFYKCVTSAWVEAKGGWV